MLPNFIKAVKIINFQVAIYTTSPPSDADTCTSQMSLKYFFFVCFFSYCCLLSKGDQQGPCEPFANHNTAIVNLLY